MENGSVKFITGQFILLAIACLMLILSCKKETPIVPEPEQDPCEGKRRLSADFRIDEQLRGFDEDGNFAYFYTETDTAVTGSVRFLARHPNADYEWHIGGGVYKQRMFSLIFSQDVIGKTIPITLIVKISHPDTFCFPEDDGLDTVTKYLTIVDGCTSRVPGEYKGNLKHKPDSSFTVKISLINKDHPDPSVCNATRYENLIDSCVSDFFGGAFGYRSNAFRSGSGWCGQASGMTKLYSVDSIFIDYYLKKKDAPVERVMFLGKRVK